MKRRIKYTEIQGPVAISIFENMVRVLIDGNEVENIECESCVAAETKFEHIKKKYINPVENTQWKKKLRKGDSGKNTKKS